MDDISLLMVDPDFAFKYTVLRRQGKWVRGRFRQGEPEELRFYGPVQPASDKEVKQLEIGDRTDGVMKFSCRKPRSFCLSQRLPDGNATAADEIIFRGERFKVMRTRPWDHYGFTHAYAIRLEVDNGNEQQDAGGVGGSVPSGDASAAESAGG